MANEEMIRAAVAALYDIDAKRLFWVDIGTATRDGASADQIAWEDLDWDQIHRDVTRWLDELDPEGGTTVANWPITEDVALVFQARPRTEIARGASKPSLTIAENPIPPLRLAGGETRSIYDLPLSEVEAFASGVISLAIMLPSHRETFGELAKEMHAFGYSNTSEMHPAILENYASMLGLVEAPPGLGDFDEGWRAINNQDFPMTDDPRSDSSE